MSESRLSRTLWACRRAIFVACGFSLAINILMLTAPIYMLQVFDRVLQSQSLETLLFLSLAALVALFTLGMLEAVRAFLFLRLSHWLDRYLGGDMLTAGIVAGLQRNQTASAQGLRDVLTLRNFLTSPGMLFILDAPWSPVFLVAIFILHPLLGWLATIGALVLAAFALINEITTRGPLLRASGAMLKSERLVETAIRNAEVVEALGMRQRLVGNWLQTSFGALQEQNAAGKRGAVITAFSKFFRLCLQVMMLGAGAFLVLQNELTAGAMIAASILMGRALAPIESAIGSWRSAISARAAMGRINAQLTDSAIDENNMPLPVPSGRLSVENLVFTYPNTTTPMIKNISFNLEPGEAIGLIGPSASGKTTLARLLVGNLIPARGAVRLDGAEMSGWNSADRGQYVGYVPQDVELFSGSVKENICRLVDASPEAVIDAAKTAGVHDMILQLPQGYESDIGDGGAVLSGGQRQRLALARAIFGPTKFVVLDEPNASLDFAGEEALVGTIAEVKRRGVTQIIISHKPSILRQVDKILVIKDGAVQKFGPRDQIMAELTRPAPQSSPAIVGGERVAD